MGDIPNWAVILLSFLASSGINLIVISYWGGKLKSNTESNTSDISKLNERVFPQDAENRPVTMSMCEKCQADCRLNNAMHFKELTEVSKENNKMLCMLIGDLGHIKGMLDIQRNKES